MSEQPPLNRTDAFSASDPELDAGLVAAFAQPASSVLRALGAVLPEVPRVQLHEPDSGASSPVVRPASDQMPDRHDPASRYQMHGEIARGGMGAVLKGRDVDLGREVALKVLLECHAGRTELLQRFVEEAQIAGQLQHPGIVPVYELGTFADQRPFFTMKLVKGQTLSKLLAQRKDPTQERTRWLGVFLQVCQALAYAHARGVIHRDLKPSNVMVGSFGEVQVMDWGLAKVLPRGGVADERASQQQHGQEAMTEIRTRRSEGSDPPGAQTEVGSVMGTPAYMAPEQALGEIDRLDERADVFGLGAILCEILTGQPPYVGNDFKQVLRQATRANLSDAFARLDGCGADAELIVLAKRCLAAEPGQRPRDAGVLADELKGYLEGVEDRLRQAELARAQAEVRAAEECKRRRVQLALVAALVGLLGLGSGGGLYLHRQHELREQERGQRQREMEAAIQTTLEKADGLQRQSRWTEARALLEQIDVQLREGPQELRERVERALADVELVDELDAIRLKKATWIDNGFDKAGADRGYTEVFARRGLGTDRDDPAVVAARVRGSAVKEHLLAALDDWAIDTTPDPRRRVWLLAVARGADPHPWRDRLRDPVVLDDEKKLQALVKEARGENLSPQLAAALGWELETEQAIELLRAVQRGHPDDFWVNFVLGTRMDRPRGEEAVGFLRVAVALRPGASAAHTNLGVALADAGKVDEAIAAYRRAIALDHRNAAAYTSLGAVLCDVKGEYEQAIRCFRKAIEIDPRKATPISNLGVALAGKGEWDEAIRCHRKALEINPLDANAHSNLGVALYRKGEVDEAIRCYRKAIELDPRHVQAHTNLGVALSDHGKVDEGIGCFRKAIEIEPRRALAHSGLGFALAKKGQLNEAIASHRKAVELDPRNATVHLGLGSALSAKGRLAEAIECLRKAVELDPRDATAHLGLGNALFRKGDCADAREALDRAVRLFPENDPSRQLAARQLQACEGVLRFEEGLARLFGGEGCIDLASKLGHQRRHAVASRFYAEAFARQPSLSQQHRYNAACSAALAAAGKCKDADTLGLTDRHALRRQALTWLRADLDRWRMLADKGDGRSRQVIAKQLMNWRQDADLAGLRDAEALKGLPGEERQACERLWTDVESLLRKLWPK